MNMKKKLALALVMTTALSLGACVVVIGHGAEDGVYWGHEREEMGIRHDGDRLSRDVARALATDQDLVAEKLSVSSKDGLVVLKGRVASIGMVERAMERASGVEGVTRVVSRITVSP